MAPRDDRSSSPHMDDIVTMAYYPPPKLKQFACTKCGYDLTGLPERGYCPECGQRFSTFGGDGADDYSDTQRKVDRLLERMRTVVLAGIGAFIIVASGLIETLRQVNGAKEPWITSWVIWTGGFLAMLFLLAAAASYANETYRTNKA